MAPSVFELAFQVSANPENHRAPWASNKRNKNGPSVKSFRRSCYLDWSCISGITQ